MLEARNIEYLNNQHEQKEVIKKQVSEYRDANGEIICTAEFELSEEYGEKMLKSLILKPTDPSQPPIDVMAMCNKRQVEIGVLDSGSIDQASYVSSPNFEMIYCPSPETPQDLVVLLHELGHADQISEELFQKINQNSVQNSKAGNPIEAITDTAKNLSPLTKETEKLFENIPPEIFTEVESIQKKTGKLEKDISGRKHRLRDKKLILESVAGGILIYEKMYEDPNKEELNRRYNEKKEIEKDIDQLEKELEELKKERKKLYEKFSTIANEHFLKILSHVVRLKEHDATKRAMQWLIKCKKMGVNLLAPDLLDPKKIEKVLPKDCTGKGHQDITDTQTLLYELLKTYDTPDINDTI